MIAISVFYNAVTVLGVVMRWSSSSSSNTCKKKTQETVDGDARIMLMTKVKVKKKGEYSIFGRR